MRSPDETLICSRAGCRAPATQQVQWRNPRIHSPDRRKIWLACDEHAPFLHDYLATRDFPVALLPLPESPESPADADADAEPRDGDESRSAAAAPAPPEVRS